MIHLMRNIKKYLVSYLKINSEDFLIYKMKKEKITMTQEEKAKRYDEAIQRARQFMETPYLENSDDVVGFIFPELKESDDERIRKALIWHLTRVDNEIPPGAYHSIDGIEIKDMLAWLEKQGEQKPVDKIEPKFKVGDWINGYYTNYKVLSVNNDGYVVEDVDGNKINILFENEKFHHLWTIQDAKDGDVLVNQNGEMSFIFKKCKNNHIYCYCGYTNREDIFFDRFVDSEGEELHWLNLYPEHAYPATKEQRDLLFSKMKEAGYEWDAEKKELRKIEQNPVWSEEDESMLYGVIETEQYMLDVVNGIKKFDVGNGNIRKACAEELNWLKSLKDRVQPQQQEWSEEDERILYNITQYISYVKENKGVTKSCYIEAQNWLKSLRPQNTWKPSDEQMKALSAINVTGGISYAGQGQELINLFSDLKKLKE